MSLGLIDLNWDLRQFKLFFFQYNSVSQTTSVILLANLMTWLDAKLNEILNNIIKSEQASIC